MSEWWFPDLSTLTNFEQAAALGVLETILAGRGRAAEAIDHEMRDAAVDGHREALASFRGRSVLGAPISIVDPADIAAVHFIRIDQLGGDSKDSMHLLGEAETVFLLRGDAEFAESEWVTDSGSTYDFGVRSGMQPLCSADLCAIAVRDGTLSLDEAFALMSLISAIDGQLPKRYPSAVDLQIASLEWDARPERPVSL
jgi:hypothetical protein